MQLHPTASAQFKQIVANYEAVLSQYKMKLGDCKKVLVYISRDCNKTNELIALVAQVWPNALWFRVERLPRSAFIEVECLATRNE